MTDLLVQFGLSNFLLSAVLAVLAWVVHRQGRYPTFAHLLWVLVLVKVVTPPVLVMPVSLGAPVADLAAASSTAGTVRTGSEVVGLAGLASWLAGEGVLLLLLVWLAGSTSVFVASARRIWTFDRLLRRASWRAPPEVSSMTASVARELGLRNAPTVRVSDARLSPMTWWTGGRVRVILPTTMLGRIDGAELRWVLAHELAHIKRRDHLVRWLEWLACVTFWWNPIVWWARRNLRLDEEDACDALVLERLEGQPRAYARSLLNAVEILAGPESCAPAVATGIDAAGSLERRLARIVSPAHRERAPRYAVVGITAAVLGSMLLGVGIAGDPEPPAIAASTGRVAEVAAKDSGGGPPPDAVRFAMVSATLRKTPGQTMNDVYKGTPQADVLIGSSREDVLVGRAGGDTLSGGAGHDVIRGGKGADTIVGGKGADTIKGGAGNDTIHGGAGRDVIDGGSGRDTIDAGAGDDVVRSWPDDMVDHIDCGSGEDRAIIDASDTARHCEVVIVRADP